MLLKRLLIALHESLIEIAIGFGFAFQLAQLDEGLVRFGVRADQAGHRQSERLLLSPRDFGVAAIAFRDSLQLLVNQTLEFLHFPSQVDDLEVSAAELAFELRFHFRSVQVFFS